MMDRYIVYFTIDKERIMNGIGITHARGEMIMDIGALATIVSVTLVVVFLRHLAPTQYCWLFGGAFLLALMGPGIIGLILAIKSDKKDWDKLTDEQIRHIARARGDIV